MRFCFYKFSKTFGNNIEVDPQPSVPSQMSYRTYVRYLKRVFLEIPHTRFGMTLTFWVNCYIVAIAFSIFFSFLCRVFYNTMKTMLRKFMLAVAVVCTLGLVSCDANDLYLEDEIIGSWSAVYEDATVFEEEAYDFDPTGRWTYRYVYENIFGENIYEVDAGTYYVRYGLLKLESNFTWKTYSFGMSIFGNRLFLKDGEYSCEFFRYR